MDESKNVVEVKVKPDFSEIEAAMAQTAIGRIVHYTLSEGDVAAIETIAPQYRTGTASVGGEYSAYQRNPVHVGQVYPAQILAVFSPKTVNLMVQLDGYGQYWATSRSWDDPEAMAERYSPGQQQPGYQPGTWHWPERV